MYYIRNFARAVSMTEAYSELPSLARRPMRPGRSSALSNHGRTLLDPSNRGCESVRARTVTAIAIQTCRSAGMSSHRSSPYRGAGEGDLRWKPPQRAAADSRRDGPGPVGRSYFAFRRVPGTCTKVTHGASLPHGAVIMPSRRDRDERSGLIGTVRLGAYVQRCHKHVTETT